MTNEEQYLIQAIKKLPGHQVFDGRNGGSVVVAVTTDSSVKQQSVWLGRSGTIERLEGILKNSFLDKQIVVAGDVWRVLGAGAQRDGNTFCHLASTTRFRQQKNGKNPIQIGDWVDTAVLIAATNQGA
jgi:hypothetical protein